METKEVYPLRGGTYIRLTPLKIKAVTLYLMKLISPNELAQYLRKLDEIEVVLNETNIELEHIEKESSIRDSNKYLKRNYR